MAVVASMASVSRRSELISTVDRWTLAPGRPRARCREEDGSRLPVNEVRALTSEVNISDRLDASAALNECSNARSAKQPVQLCLHL